MNNEVVFKPVSRQLALQLIAAVRGKKVGTTIDIDGETYTYDYCSIKSAALHRGRGFSLYFKVGKSIIRISDHWTRSNGNDRSRKFNCGAIGSMIVHTSDGDIEWDENKPQYWVIDNDDQPFESTYLSGRFPHRLLAGKASLAKLNKVCEHWK